MWSPVVTRVLDSTMGHPVVVAAGLLWGTRAAGECVTQPSRLEGATRFAPGDWKHKNIQVVVSTKVMARTQAPARIGRSHLVT